MFKYGIISEVKKGFAKVSFAEDNIVSDWLPVLVRKSKSDKESWQLEINEHVVCLMDEYCNEGVILGAIYSETDAPDPGEAKGKFRKLFSDGSSIEYDKNSHKLTVDIKGSLEAKTTGAAKIEAGTTLEAKAAAKATIEAPAIDLTGNVKITGTATILGALTAAAIATSGTGAITAGGSMTIQGKITSNDDVVAGTKSLKSHVHSGVTTGPGTSGPPV